jgi:uncharacterized paraquat-inducible protein A
MMLVLQTLRLALIVAPAVIWVMRNRWTHLFVYLKLNVLWLVLAYVALTVTIRILERRRRRARALATTEGPWTCEVCETENPDEATRCTRCTVPRPQGAS